ncbi:MAG: hypothetical protein QG608_2468, partial [Actinomycetota bacterium]|nr:hypothetical protein [Actinomycetota bacterium]
MSRISKKTLVASTAVLLLAGGVAYAFSTYATGGSLNTTVATAKPVELSNGPIVNLWPGNPAVEIPVTYNNPNPGPIDVVGATVKVKSVVPETCPVEALVIDPNLTSPVTVPVGQGAWPAPLPKIALAATAPDVCQGAVVELEYGTVPTTPPTTEEPTTPPTTEEPTTP